MLFALVGKRFVHNTAAWRRPSLSKGKALQADATSLVALGAGAAGLAGLYFYASSHPRQVTKYAYIHGFASSPKAMKGTVVKASFNKVGLPFEVPDMNQPTAETMTCTSSLKELDRLHAEAQAQCNCKIKWCFIGSSMGGYLAARWAELHPDQVEKLVLLSPAFNFPQVIERIMQPKGSRLSDWKASGSWPFGRLRVDWCMIDDYLQHTTEPHVQCPTLIIHGTRDDLVPIGIARSFASTHRDRIRLVELDDDHLLAQSMPTMVPLISDFFNLRPSLPAPDPPSTSGLSQFDSADKSISNSELRGV